MSTQTSTPLPKSDDDIIKDEGEARLWMAATGLEVSHFIVLQRVAEIDALVQRLPEDLRAAWAATQIMQITTGNDGYRLKDASVKTIEARLARGEATPFGRVLKNRRLDFDVRLRWMLHSHARGPIA
jgi:hypothetical protein